MVRGKSVSRLHRYAGVARAAYSAYRAYRSFRGRRSRAPRRRSTLRSGPFARGKGRRFRSRRPSRLGKYVRKQVVKTSSVDQVYTSSSSLHPTCPSDTVSPCTWFDYGCLYQAFDVTSMMGNLAKLNPAVASYNDRFWIKDATLRFSVSNLSNAGCVLTAYTVVARKNLPAVAGTVPGSVVLPSGNYLTNLFSAGLYERVPVTNGQTTGSINGLISSMFGDPSTTAFNSPLFCRYFKVLRTRTYRMEGGGSCSVSVSSKRFRRIESDMTIGNVALRGSIGVLFHLKGVPAVDSGTDNVGLTSPHLAIVVDRRYHFCTIPLRSETQYMNATSINALAEPEVMGVYTESPLKESEL